MGLGIKFIVALFVIRKVSFFDDCGRRRCFLEMMLSGRNLRFFVRLIGRGCGGGDWLRNEQELAVDG